MMFLRLRFVHSKQRGFTLIEIVVAIALVGLIAGGITAAIMQILTINTRASNHMIAVRQVQQAGKEVSKDALQSQNVTYTENPDFLLTLAWTDWEGVENAVNYTIEDNELLRSHNLEGIRVIAQYIDPDPAQTSCDPLGELPDNSVLTFTVTATVGTESETRIYEIGPRPDP